jgi:hypothetical protein
MATTIKKVSPKPLPMKMAPKPLPMLDKDDNPEAGKPDPVQSVAKSPIKNVPAKVVKAPKEYGDDGSGIDEEPSAKYNSSQPTASIIHKHKDGSETETQETVGGLKKFSSQPSVVTLSMAVTRNLGNFESVKMMVSLSMPCENSDIAREEAFNEVKGWVDNRVEMLNQEVNDQLA